jgi:hypothetical protein
MLDASTSFNDLLRTLQRRHPGKFFYVDYDAVTWTNPDLKRALDDDLGANTRPPDGIHPRTTGMVGDCESGARQRSRLLRLVSATDPPRTRWSACMATATAALQRTPRAHLAAPRTGHMQPVHAPGAPR